MQSTPRLFGQCSVDISITVAVTCAVDVAVRRFCWKWILLIIHGNCFSLKMSNFDEKLIEATKRREVIYNPANKSNRYVELKEEAWKQISMELDTPVTKCKARWASLRDRYRRITKAQQNDFKNDIKTHSKWRYYDALTFLSYSTPQTTNNDFDGYSVAPDFEGETMFSLNQLPKVEYSSIPTKAKRIDESIKEFIAPKTDVEVKEPTDMFFMALSRRIKAANLPSLTQMKLESEILNFTIHQLEQIRNTGTMY